jgi:hypothetical protein
MLVDPFETTLVVREQLLRILPDPVTVLAARRVIVLEGQLPDDLVGFMAALSAAIADRGIWLLALGAATRDHLLVADNQLAEAIDALAALAGANTPAP